MPYYNINEQQTLCVEGTTWKIDSILATDKTEARKKKRKFREDNSRRTRLSSSILPGLGSHSSL